MNDLNSEHTQHCPKVSTHTAAVNLPVCITPYAITSPAHIKCCGETTITPTCNISMESYPSTCEFIITQKIQVDLPIEFGATVTIGDTFIDCECSPCCEHHEEY